MDNREQLYWFVKGYIAGVKETALIDYIRALTESISRVEIDINIINRFGKYLTVDIYSRSYITIVNIQEFKHYLDKFFDKLKENNE